MIKLKKERDFQKACKFIKLKFKEFPFSRYRKNSKNSVPRDPFAVYVLGSGFKVFLDEVKIVRKIALKSIPGFVTPRVSGHGSELILAKIGPQDSYVWIFTGRAHLYEGHSADEIVFPIRVFARLGMSHLILTNAAGSLSLDFKPGQLVAIEDHINLAVQNCLVGTGVTYGPQFLDMSDCYNSMWREKFVRKAGLAKGVYACMLGPTYETKAECKLLKVIGADLVGMSTAHEATAAHQMGVKVFAISLVTNWTPGALQLQGKAGEPLHHAEVIAIAQKAKSEILRVLEIAYDTID